MNDRIHASLHAHTDSSDGDEAASPFSAHLVIASGTSGGPEGPIEAVTFDGKHLQQVRAGVVVQSVEASAGFSAYLATVTVPPDVRAMLAHVHFGAVVLTSDRVVIHDSTGAVLVKLGALP